MKPCPHCGLIGQGFFVNGTIGGPASAIFNAEGKYSELDMDKIYWAHSSDVVRCANCGKIRHDVYLYDRVTIKEN